MPTFKSAYDSKSSNSSPQHVYAPLLTNGPVINTGTSQPSLSSFSGTPSPATCTRLKQELRFRGHGAEDMFTLISPINDFRSKWCV